MVPSRDVSIFVDGLRLRMTSRRLAAPGRMKWQCTAVQSIRRKAEVAEDGRGDVDQRGAGVAGAGGEAAAGDEEERALLVFAEAAVLAETGGVLGL